MSDLPPELPRPLPPRTWRDHVADLAESFDLSPRRLLLGVVVLACAATVGWRLLAPAAPPAEMRLPFAESAAGGPATGGASGGPAGSRAAEAVAGGTAGEAAGAVAAGTATTGTAAELVVHVAGAVVSPGVQRLPPGSRVIDAVEAAGGAQPDADLPRVNLAAPLVDGQQVYIPRPGEQPPEVTGVAAGGAPGATGAVGSAAGGLVNLNSATAEQLDTLPGVGPTTAAAIIAHRDQHGPFTAVDQLIDVRGIGEAKLAQLRDLVTI
jgi:competence protein ComEA